MSLIDPLPGFDEIAVHGRSILLAAQLGLFGLQGTSMVSDEWEPPAEVFFSHGQPPDDCCEFLAVWNSAVRQTSDQSWPQGTLTPIPCGDGRLAMDYVLTVKRKCLPTVTADRDHPFPEREAEDDAAQDLAVTGRIIWCAVVYAYHAGVLLPEGYDAIFGTMVPVRSGGCGGWRWPITVEATVCCSEMYED